MLGPPVACFVGGSQQVRAEAPLRDIGVRPDPHARESEAATAPTAEQARRELARSFASESAFRQLYEDALPRVYGYLFRRCGADSFLAEDLCQATFLEAVRHRNEFDGRSSVISWLTGIARHKLVDHFRAIEREERRRMRLVVREIAMDHDAAAWQAAEARDELVEALARLPSMQRAALVLHYADGLDVDRVAGLLGRSVHATESLLARARASLRQAYGAPLDGRESAELFR